MPFVGFRRDGTGACASFANHSSLVWILVTRILAVRDFTRSICLILSWTDLEVSVYEFFGLELVTEFSGFGGVGLKLPLEAAKPQQESHDHRRRQPHARCVTLRDLK